MKRKVIFGIGNSLRGDDGIGPRLIEELRAPNFPDAVVLVPTLQLLPEHTEILAQAKAALFVDASLSSPAGDIQVKKVPDIPASASTLHELNPSSLLALLKEIQGKTMPAEMMEIGIDRIGHEEKLSKKVEAAIPRAVDMIRSWIELT